MDDSSEKRNPRTKLSEELVKFEQRIYPLLMRGEGEAWNEFYEHYSGRLLAHYQRMAVDENDQEDLLQETMVVIIRRLPAYNPERASFHAWIYGIANMVGRHYATERSRRLSSEKTGDKALDQAASQAGNPFEKPDRGIDPRLLKLEAILPTLPEKDQQILKLRASRTGVTWDDLGQEMGIGTSAAKMRYQRALDRLRETMMAV